MVWRSRSSSSAGGGSSSSSRRSSSSRSSSRVVPPKQAKKCISAAVPESFPEIIPFLFYLVRFYQFYLVLLKCSFKDVGGTLVALGSFIRVFGGTLVAPAGTCCFLWVPPNICECFSVFITQYFKMRFPTSSELAGTSMKNELNKTKKIA